MLADYVCWSIVPAWVENIELADATHLERAIAPRLICERNLEDLKAAFRHLLCCLCHIPSLVCCKVYIPFKTQRQVYVINCGEYG